MHIVLLDYRDISHPEAGGAEIYLHEIFQRIAARGHRVTLICGRHDRDGGDVRGESEGLRRSAPSPSLPRKPGEGVQNAEGVRSAEGVDVSSANALPRSPGKGQGGGAPSPDTAHAHSPFRILRVGNKATMNVAGALAARRLARREPVDLIVENICKIPFFTPLSTSVPVLPIVLHLFGKSVFQETNVAFGSYVWLYEQLIPRVYRDLRFVTISQSTADDLLQRGVRTPGIDIVSPGIDLKRFTPGGPKDEAPLLVYVGMLKRYKGLDIVLRAFARVRQTLPAARLAFIGRGTDRPRLEALVQQLGLAEAVHFAGWVTEDEKIDWLRRAHAMVYPSVKEGWGIPTIEAGACQTPSLASHVAGLRDAVRDGETGYLIAHQDEDAWVARMLDVLGDPAQRDRLGQGARRWAERFSWDAQAELMLDVVERVARRG